MRPCNFGFGTLIVFCLELEDKPDHHFASKYLCSIPEYSEMKVGSIMDSKMKNCAPRHMPRQTVQTNSAHVFKVDIEQDSSARCLAGNALRLMKLVHQHAEADEMESMKLNLGLMLSIDHRESLLGFSGPLSTLCVGERPYAMVCCEQIWSNLCSSSPLQSGQNHVQTLMASRFPRLNTAHKASVHDLPGLRIGTIRCAFTSVIW